MGLGETGWYVGLQEGARLRPSGQNQGQAQLTLARQPGLDQGPWPGPDQASLWVGLLLLNEVRPHGQGIVRLVLSFRVCCMGQLQ